MIKIEHVVMTSGEQMEFVIEGMRNPMNSWNLSDSASDYDGLFILGDNDCGLMSKLSKAGTTHRKFMRMIPIFVRITAPLYWWKEFDTYKIGTVSNSCSTMHKIQEKEFTLDDFSHEHMAADTELMMEEVIKLLNSYREDFNETKDKLFWWQMIQLLPSSYNQTRNVMLNYEVLVNIYNLRKSHKLDEWRKFCEWIESLPFAELITETERSEDIE